MLKSFRYVLFPFSIVYGLVIWGRNKLFDKKILRSLAFNFPVICVGNLAVGGTGKTPMIEYLIRFLKDDFKVATLSRGYKRKTKGFAMAAAGTTAIEIGDEPMQVHLKFPEITVAVDEERIVGIPLILQAHPDTDVILLDDAFQHRTINAGLNILLTDYNNLFTRDILLPAGDLRDMRGSSSRAHIIVVTKCKPDLNEIERQKIISEIRPTQNQKVYFTRIDYGTPYHLYSKKEQLLDSDSQVLLICGIANPQPLKDLLTQNVSTYEILNFRDHHIFNTDDLKDIKKSFSKLSGENKIILTTEKDGVRLFKFDKELNQLPIYVLPIKHEFLFEEKTAFNNQISGFIRLFSKTDL